MDSLIQKRENSEINNCYVSCLKLNVKRNHKKKRTKSLSYMKIEPATKTVSLHMGNTATANENKVKNSVKCFGFYTPSAGLLPKFHGVPWDLLREFRVSSAGSSTGNISSTARW